jgi:DprA winged helix domain
MKSPFDRNSKRESAARHRQKLMDEFNSKYKSEDACMRALLAEIAVSECYRCGSERLIYSSSRRNARCADCKMKLSFTAGTFFDGITRARPWLAAIWLLERGADINAHQLHLMVDVAYSTAWVILKKIFFVVQVHMDGEREKILERSRLFAKIFCKRSTRTPVCQHPRLEQDAIENQETPDSAPPPQDSFDETEQDSGPSGEEQVDLTGDQKKVFDLLSDEPIKFDSLCARTGFSASHLITLLTMLEILGCAVRCAGDSFARTSNQSEKSLPALTGRSSTGDRSSNLVDAALDFLKRNFHGISRKYLQTYLAAFWCRADRERWACGSLWAACRASGRITLLSILDYVSPIDISLMPLAESME